MINGKEAPVPTITAIDIGKITAAMETIGTAAHTIWCSASWRVAYWKKWFRGDSLLVVDL